MSSLIVAVTGASGSCYAYRLLEALAESGVETDLVISPTGRQVVDYEMKGDRRIPAGVSASSRMEQLATRTHAADDLFSPVASGSAPVRGMIVIPCSMGSLGRIAGGAGGSLIERAADVQLKEGRPLILVPRETPFNLIQLRNMTSLAEAGAVILPAMPGFYQRPDSIDDLVDFVVARVLDRLAIPHSLGIRWQGGEEG